jgi:glycosyltransferase involved in cell wall biosynthesis
LPRITVVTPSYNQGGFIEATIRSILLQAYPNLEYIIVDGGSTDGSLDIIRKYEPWITAWVSEPDRGMYDAINKGFARSTGEIMAWSNTDDVFLPGAFLTIGSVFRQLPEVQWLTSLYKVQWDENGHETRRYQVKGFNRRAFYRGRNLLGRNPYATFMIQQQSTFWRRSLWERIGGRVDDTMDLAGDFDLWARFYQHAELYGLDEPIGVFRSQPNQKTAKYAQEYLAEAERALEKAGGEYPGRLIGWLRSRVLSRVPSRWLGLLGGIPYEAKMITRNSQEAPWAISKHYFV